MAFSRLRYFLILFLLAVVAWSGNSMLHLALWGYLPFWFLAALWGATVLFVSTRYTRHPLNLSLLGASLGSGCLLWLGFPTMPFTFLMFVGFVPLLWVYRQVRAHSSPKSHWQLFRYVFCAMLTWNILSTWWVCNAGFLAGIVANILNALLMTVPWVMYHRIEPRLKLWQGYVALVSFWMTFEHIHQSWDMSWPWLTLGNALAQQPTWIQWYAWTGTSGGTLWILVVNILCYSLLRSRLDAGIFPVFRRWLPIIAALVVPIFISVLIYVTYSPTGETVEVVAIQPNYEPFYEKFDIPDNVQWQRFTKLSEEKLTPNTAFLVFPETSFSVGEEHELGTNSNVRTAKDLVQKYPRLALATGSDSYWVFRAGESTSGHDAIRDKPRYRDTLHYEAYNSALLLTAKDSMLQVYHKSKLVPGPEVLPFKHLLGFLQPIVQHLGGTMAGLGTQRERAVFRHGKLAIAPVICYESIYGDYSTGYIRNGAQAIFIMTNDGWWDDTPGYLQHRAFSQLRAIETRRDVVRAANTGSSCSIDQRGCVTQATPYNVATAIRGNMRFNSAMTFYARFGEILSWLAVLVGCILFLAGVLKGRHRDVSA